MIIKPCSFRESRLSYTRHAVGDDDGCQFFAILESRGSYARHTVRDGDFGQAAATIESTSSNTRHRVGNGNRSQTATFFESKLVDRGHFISDNYFLNGRIASKPRFNGSTMQFHGGQAAATFESTPFDARHTVGDGDGGKPAAI